MNAVWFVALWVLAGAAVLFVAFSGGPARARETYLTRGGRGVTIAFVVIFIAAGVIVPVLISTDSTSAVGGTGPLTDEKLSPQLTEGKALFRENCAGCHTLAAVQAHGVTGPNLDEIGQVDRQRVLNAIREGGTGQNRMPKNIVQGGDAQAVAAYVAKVAARPGKDTGELAKIGQPAGGGKTVVAKNGVLQIDADPSGALAFTAAKAEAPAGKVEFVMKNPSPIQHDIGVKGSGANAKGPVVGNGGTSRFETTLKPGKYTFYCSVAGHEAGGMKGELTVD